MSTAIFRNGKGSFIVCCLVALLLIFYCLSGTEFANGNAAELAGYENNSYEKEDTVYKGRYLNQEYLFSFTIPVGLICVGDAPPAPNHGCRIDLSKAPSSYIWAIGNYNVLDRLYPAEELMLRMGSIVTTGMDILILKRNNISLGSLQGERLAVSFRKINSNKSIDRTVEDTVVAFRTIEGHGDNVIYVMGLVTTESRYESDSKIFEVITKSWIAESAEKFQGHHTIP